MPKRPDNLETTKFTIELLRRIPRHKKISAVELHDQLKNIGIERDLRTIQRHLESLTDHFDIERDDRSKPYGYKWKEFAGGFSLPMLSEQESLLLALAHRHLQSLLPTSLMKSMETFFNQAAAKLDPLRGNGKPETEWLSKVKVVSTSQPLLPPKIKSGVFEAVSTALYKNLWLEIEYQNAGGKRKASSIMPLGLAQQGERLYLVCRYHGFDNERSLAMHRIQTAQVSGINFERPVDFNLQKYEDDGRFGAGNGTRIRLSFLVQKKAGLHLLESPLSKDQTVDEQEQCYFISATVIDSPQLERWLRGFGDEITQVKKIIS